MQQSPISLAFHCNKFIHNFIPLCDHMPSDTSDCKRVFLFLQLAMPPRLYSLCVEALIPLMEKIGAHQEWEGARGPLDNLGEDSVITQSTKQGSSVCRVIRLNDFECRSPERGQTWSGATHLPVDFY
jgi:hypothetical protein